jgi:hypothetical protein
MIRTRIAIKSDMNNPKNRSYPAGSSNGSGIDKVVIADDALTGVGQQGRPAVDLGQLLRSFLDVPGGRARLAATIKPSSEPGKAIQTP